jgi:hypothetical protein
LTAHLAAFDVAVGTVVVILLVIAVVAAGIIERFNDGAIPTRIAVSRDRSQDARGRPVRHLVTVIR